MLHGFLQDRVIENMQPDHQEGGKKADWFYGGLYNMFGGDAEGVVDKAYGQRQKTAAEQKIASSEFDAGTLGQYGDLSTPNGVSGAIARATRARNKEDDETRVENALKPLEKQLAAQEKTADKDRDAAKDRFGIQMEQLRNDRIRADLNAALERESRADNNQLQMQIAMAKIASEDRARHDNLQLRREEFQKNRSAELVAGLTSLASLFFV